MNLSGFLILYGIFIKVCCSVLLPDGRELELVDPLSYPYHIESNVSSLTRTYLLLEFHPNTALLCPKEFFINQIIQELIIKKESNNTENTTINFEKSEKDTGIPCPTLLRCLGFQACLFKFGNELCRKDPAAGYRKALLVTITCHVDAKSPDEKIEFSGAHRRKMSEVLHLRYKTHLDENEQHEADSRSILLRHRNYNETNIIEERIPEKEIFSGGCPVLKNENGNKFWYKGVCESMYLESMAVIQSLWSILGRVRSQECRQKLTNVFCAFQYNRDGLCIPPHVTNHDSLSKRLFNFQSLPSPVPRKFSAPLNHQQNIHHSLIPARLAFFVLVHKDVLAAAQLLQAIWRPQHFYVFHVDKRFPQSRKELKKSIADRIFSRFSNVIILPGERSFPSCWGSYEIVRAQLECLEELLRLDDASSSSQWDFAINLSGADLPLRDVDDLAAALSEHRNFNFLPFVHWVNNPDELAEKVDEGSLLKSAFYACDDYLFNVTSINGMPHYNSLKIYNAPQWGVFSRKFAIFLVDELERPASLNRFQFYLQTMAVPDESYFATLLLNSQFRNTLKVYPVHTTKDFLSTNTDNLCRHFTDADFCGQGPALYEENDFLDLMSASHNSFFARKFSAKVDHVTRKFALELASGGYQKFVREFLPPSVIRVLAKGVLSRLPSTFFHKLHLLSVTKIRLFPDFASRDSCEKLGFLERFRRLTTQKLWLDLAFVSKSAMHEKRICRTSLTSSINTRVCFEKGDLKLIFLDLWKRYSQIPQRIFNLQTFPLPYGRTGQNEISVFLFFSKGNSTDYSIEGKQPISIMNSGISFPLKWSLVDSKGITRCSHVVSVDLSKGLVISENKDENSTLEGSPNSKYTVFSKKAATLLPHLAIYHIIIKCESMESGLWHLTFNELDNLNAYTYRIPFYLMDFENKVSETQVGKDVWRIWKISNIDVFTQFARATSYFHNYQLPDKQDNFAIKSHYNKIRLNKNVPGLTTDEQKQSIKMDFKYASPASLWISELRTYSIIYVFLSELLLLVFMIYVYKLRFLRCRRFRRTRNSHLVICIMAWLILLMNACLLLLYIEK